MSNRHPRDAKLAILSVGLELKEVWAGNSLDVIIMLVLISYLNAMKAALFDRKEIKTEHIEKSQCNA